MIISSNYKKRREDIEVYYAFLRFLLSFETHRQRTIQNADTGESLIITQEMQCVAKAQSFILLYNLVESTVCDCLNAIYDAIQDDNLKYSNVSDEIKTMWLNHLKRNGQPITTYDEDTLLNMSITFESLVVNISGSLDFRKIQQVFSKHGCLLNDSKRDIIAQSFLVVKNKRNLLAHGNLSFSDCGAKCLMSDLQLFKQNIVEYMQDVVDKTHDYIARKAYKLNTESVKA